MIPLVVSLVLYVLACGLLSCVDWRSRVREYAAHLAAAVVCSVPYVLLVTLGVGGL